MGHKLGVSEEWRDIKYNETFEQEITGLSRRLNFDPNCKIEDLEGILNSLYIMDGADQGGRGLLGDTIMAATIAAYEHFIQHLKSSRSL